MITAEDVTRFGSPLLAGVKANIACWPIAVIHSIGAGPDVRSGPLLWLTVATTAAVAIAIAVRTAAALRAASSAAQIRQLLAGHITREAASR